jgi:hypothetical protein
MNEELLNKINQLNKDLSPEKTVTTRIVYKKGLKPSIPSIQSFFYIAMVRLIFFTYCYYSILYFLPKIKK